MKEVLPIIEEALNRLRARQMVTEIAVMELTRALSPQARRTFAERFPAQVAAAIEQTERFTPAIEDQMVSLLMALQRAAGDRGPSAPRG